MYEPMRLIGRLGASLVAIGASAACASGGPGNYVSEGDASADGAESDSGGQDVTNHDGTGSGGDARDETTTDAVAEATDDAGDEQDALESPPDASADAASDVMLTPDSPVGCSIDDFTSGTDGWTLFGLSGFSLTVDTADSAAYISGAGFNGTCAAAGMQKTFAVAPSTTVTLSLGFRAASGTTSPNTTNASLTVVDTANPSTTLFHTSLTNGGSTDTGWQSYSTGLSAAVAGHASILVQLYLVDCWSMSWNQQNWYRQIQVCQSTGTE